MTKIFNNGYILGKLRTGIRPLSIQKELFHFETLHFYLKNSISSFSSRRLYLSLSFSTSRLCHFLATLVFSFLFTGLLSILGVYFAQNDSTVYTKIHIVIVKIFFF